MRTRLRLALVCLATMLAVACASLPKHPVSRTAEIGNRTLAGVKTVQEIVIAAETAKTLPTDRAAAVMIVTYQAGVHGENLAKLLAAYDAATEVGRANLAVEIANLVRALDGALNTIIKTPLGPNADRIGKLVASVLTTLNELRAVIPGLLVPAPTQ